MSVWKWVGGVAGGAIGFFAGGPAGAAAGASIGYGMGATADANNAAEDALANNQFNARNHYIDRNSGIGQGTFGLTPQEQARKDQAIAERTARFGDPGVRQREMQERQAALQQFEKEWDAKNPASGHDPVENSRGGITPQATREARERSIATDPQYQALKSAATKAEGMYRDSVSNEPQFDMSDPGRFAAMSETAQGRAGQQLTRYGVDKTAAPDMVDMQRTAGPEIYEMQRQNAPLTHEMSRFQANQFDIDPNAGIQDYQNAQQVRAKNMEVMGGVQDRAMGRGGPSVAELQMKQGQDRAIAGQAALAASGGQMDYAQARRQAMLGAADIQQRTASDTGILRANEQIAAQQTFGTMSKDQQSADLYSRGQTMGQANARAQFLSGQALSNAQFQAQQERDIVNSRVQQGQFGAQFGLSQEQAIAQSMAQQRQFGSQFGLNQEQQIAQQRIQQGQFNAQFGSSQDQWAAQFQAQQAMNQAQVTQQQRAQNDAYQQMLLGQYMQSRGMQQQNDWHNQQAGLQTDMTQAGVTSNRLNAEMGQANSQRQQATAMIGMGATMGASGVANGMFSGGGAPATGATNQFSNPNIDAKKIDWGY